MGGSIATFLKICYPKWFYRIHNRYSSFFLRKALGTWYGSVETEKFPTKFHIVRGDLSFIVGP